MNCQPPIVNVWLHAVEHLRSVAETLARLTTAQLAAVQHLLSDPIVDATLRARAINGTNQGRSREEKLISKLLMSEHTDPELTEIEVCSDQAWHYDSSFLCSQHHHWFNLWIVNTAHLAVTVCSK